MRQEFLKNCERIAAALERLAPPAPDDIDLHPSDAYMWSGKSRIFTPISRVAHVEAALLRGVTMQYDRVLANTRRFAEGLPANNVMLWGARGMGKSSIVKVAHADVNQALPHALAIIEIQAGDLASLPDLMRLLRGQARRCIIFCDDLSFESQDMHYKLLKSALDGGLAGRPENVLFYATSNRRHLMPRDMMENESDHAIDPKEVVEEKVSLSDRFGLWIGLHGCDQATYLDMVDAYADASRLRLPREKLHQEALIWSLERGNRSGRVAKQFIDSLDTTQSQ